MARTRTAIALVGYGLLSAGALAWSWSAGRWNVFEHPQPWWSFSVGPWLSFSIGVGWAVSLVLGIGIAVAVTRGTRWAVLNTRWARELHCEFRSLLGPLSTRQIAFFACGSGIAEELFFRGAMQPVVGLAVMSLVFGAAHFVPLRVYWPWTVSAAVIGLALGVVFVATGSLLGPIVAHVAINYENMHFIEVHDPSAASRGSGPHAGRTIPIPRLVAPDGPSPRRAPDRSTWAHSRDSTSSS